MAYPQILERIHFQSIDSTNAWARLNVETCNKNALTIITADEQTAGKGRSKRIWISPPQMNLYATFLFYVPLNQRDIGNIGQIMALSAMRAMEPFILAAAGPVNFSKNVKLKWPNDLLIGDLKCGGILTEVFQAGNIQAIAIGIGINVNAPKEQLQTIERPATSLLVELGKAVSVEHLLDLLINEFSSALVLFKREGFSPFLQPYRNGCAHEKGEEISFHLHGKKINGQFVQISPQGLLELRLSCGKIIRCSSGELEVTK